MHQLSDSLSRQEHVQQHAIQVQGSFKLAPHAINTCGLFSELLQEALKPKYEAEHETLNGDTWKS